MRASIVRKVAGAAGLALLAVAAYLLLMKKVASRKTRRIRPAPILQRPA
jgi:hypothetical protein